MPSIRPLLLLAWSLLLARGVGSGLFGAGVPPVADPTPASARREMTTDRPDSTESPFTVEAGRTQLEMDFFSHTRSDRDGARVRQRGLAAFNLRCGISRDFEAGLFISPWARVTEEPRGGPRETSSGFGDLTLRAKYNFGGNDGGGSAVGLIADLTLPTAARGLGRGSLEGQVLFPVAFDLDGGFGLGAMTGLALRRKAEGSGYRAVGVSTISLSRDVTENIGSYFELTSEAGEGTHVAGFDVGLTFKVNANTQLDGGLNFGLSRAADDLVVFAGLARRF